MLSAEDIQQIKNKIHCMDHDFYFWSFFMGEPGLNRGFLHYYDGRSAFICGRNLDSRLSFRNYEDYLKRIVVYYEKHHPTLEYMEIWAVDERVLESPLMETLPWTYVGPNAFNVNIIMDLREYDIRRAQNYKYARNFKETVKESRIYHATFLGAEHICLIKRFFAEHALDNFDLVYYGSLQGLLRSGHALVFEVWNAEDHLIGFSVVNTYFENHPIFLMGFYDHDHKHVCDFLYMTIFEYFRHTKAGILDLGYSINQSLYEYKLKWNPSIILEPRGHLCWMAASRKSAFYHWLPPLILGEEVYHAEQGGH
jgi:hypothetical protein